MLALEAAFGGWQPPIYTGSELAWCVDGPQMSRASPSGISGSGVDMKVRILGVDIE
ncbi:hypothetical protein [Mycolicibacterium sp. YH-1]|uniref:hypothetical protein n=1 Tax=Mycolicibacterium sp. YH-1 TaxID=2908837 RepID=UPI001F4C45BB|nr:hypothetical protein [Mycolicibacterium sp. YH-1]UNB52625.1 hypothetical protein L0M16_33115 [Mycolicibacterium sp. YH-1]